MKKAFRRKRHALVIFLYGLFAAGQAMGETAPKEDPAAKAGAAKADAAKPAEGKKAAAKAAAAESAPAVDAKKILAAAESHRNPADDYRLIVTLANFKDGKPDGVERKFETLVKDGRRTLVRFLTPDSESGKKLLMIDNNMWFYAPTSSKAIRIAPKQRVSGNAVYGDVAKVSFTDNYDATFNRKDTFGGKDVYVLDLKAIKDRPVTYDRIEYWIQVEGDRPVKALYSTASGKLLREGYFEDYKKIEGEYFPTTLRLVDALKKDRETKLTFTDQQQKKLPASLFDQNRLSD